MNHNLLGAGALTAALLLFGSLAQADTLIVDRVKRESGMSAPNRGMSMSAVAAQFGEPAEKAAPVGGGSVHQPPITRWVYPQFSVYFENDHVVHTVANRASALEIGPKPVQ